MPKMIAIYNQNCTMAGHQADIEISQDGEPIGPGAGDVTTYPLTGYQANVFGSLARQSNAGPDHYYYRCARTIRENL